MLFLFCYVWFVLFVLVFFVSLCLLLSVSHEITGFLTNLVCWV